MKPSTIWKIRGKDQWGLISKGKTFTENPIWIRWCAPEIHKSDPVRLGFAISKKYGNAVLRNKFKRRVREVTRKNTKDSELLNGKFLLVGVTKSNDKSVSNLEIENAFSAFISSLK